MRACMYMWVRKCVFVVILANEHLNLPPLPPSHFTSVLFSPVAWKCRREEDSDTKLIINKVKTRRRTQWNVPFLVFLFSLFFTYLSLRLLCFFLLAYNTWVLAVVADDGILLYESRLLLVLVFFFFLYCLISRPIDFGPGAAGPKIPTTVLALNLRIN